MAQQHRAGWIRGSDDGRGGIAHARQNARQFRPCRLSHLYGAIAYQGGTSGQYLDRALRDFAKRGVSMAENPLPWRMDKGRAARPRHIERVARAAGLAPTGEGMAEIGKRDPIHSGMAAHPPPPL